jgi:hypothetical protein
MPEHEEVAEMALHGSRTVAHAPGGLGHGAVGGHIGGKGPIIWAEVAGLVRSPGWEVSSRQPPRGCQPFLPPFDRYGAGC